MIVRTMDEVKEAIQKDDEGKRDLDANTASIRYDQGALIVTGTDMRYDHGVYVIEQKVPHTDDQTLPLSDWATFQFCNKMGVPTLYFRRCPNGLQVEQAEQWLHEKYGDSSAAGKEWLLRIKNGECRAVLSDRFTVFDNHHVVEVLDKLDADLGRPSIPRFRLDDKVFYVALHFPKDELVKVGNIGTACIVVLNSEVGAHAVEVRYVLHVNETNATIQIPVRFVDKAFRHKHIGISSEALTDAVNTAVRGLPGISKMMEFAVAKSVSKGADDKTFEMIEEKAGEGWALKVKEKLAGKTDWSVWDVANALSNLAEEGEMSVESKIMMDDLAGELLLNA